MGKIVVEKKRKKKGRPSLLDIQKRNLKLQQQQQQQREEELRQTQQQQQLKLLKRKPENPNPITPVRRSTRRNPNLDPDNSADDEEDDDGEEQDEQSACKRREKKLRLVHNLPNSSANSALSCCGSDLEGEDDNGASTSHKRRKIEAIGDGSSVKVEIQGGSTNQANSRPEIDLDDGPSTPLPDKKLLLFVLDRLQKKDTYGVFAEPVDPEELPDYHEVIEHPMDFSTIRKNVTNGVYKSLEHFERDVFLLCSNAMQYNAPDTVYFRQARAIQELAQKNFDNLRQDSDDENEPEPEPKVVRRGRPPTKNLKKITGRPSLERADSSHPETTPTGGQNTYRSNLELKKISYDKYVMSDLSGRIGYGSRHGEVYISWSAEKNDRHVENIGSTSKGISVKHGKKQVVLDESRRNTYMRPGPATDGQDSSSVLTTFNGERKQLVPVGIHSQFGYARSLALFAAKLGPVAWKVASKKIERCLPPGVKFGPGWVGENDVDMKRSLDLTIPSCTPTTAATTTKTCHPESGCDKIPPHNSLVTGSTSLQPIPTLDNSGSQLDNTAATNPPVLHTATDTASSSLVVTTSPPQRLISGSHHNNSQPVPVDSTRCVQDHKSYSLLQVQPLVNGANGFNVPAYMGKLLGPTRPPSPTTIGFDSQSNLTVSAASSGTDTRKCDAPKNLSPVASPQKKNDGSSNCSLDTSGMKRMGSQSSSDHVPAPPPDLNVGFNSPASPGGQLCAKPVQPDLALQL